MLYLILVATLTGPAQEPPAPKAPAVPGDAGTTRYTTPNFIVEAPSKEAARLIGKHAEAEREWLASLWLGKEAPILKERCLIRVKAGKGEASGVSTFEHDEAATDVPKQEITLEGPIGELGRDALSREVMHSLLVQRLGVVPPRWVLTGAGIMTQGEHEQKSHLDALRTALGSKKVMRLAQLFELQEYPSNWQTMYAQSFSVTRFLVERKDRETYLSFVQRGMQHGWDDAVQRYYGLDNVAELEAAWLKSVKQSK
jgi:hypothetical protein